MQALLSLCLAMHGPCPPMEMALVRVPGLIVPARQLAPQSHGARSAHPRDVGLRSGIYIRVSAYIFAAYPLPPNTWRQKALRALCVAEEAQAQHRLHK